MVQGERRRSGHVIIPAIASLLFLSVSAAGDVAKAGVVQLRARGGGRVEVVLPAGLRGRPIRLTVDGRRLPITARLTFSIRGLPSSWPRRWNWLELQGRKVTATAHFVVGSRSGADPPTLVLTSAPARTKSPSPATFRYSSSAGTVSCSLDGAPYGCSSRAAHVTANPGRHVFRVRARSGHGSAAVAWVWTVADAHPNHPSTTTSSNPAGSTSSGSGSAPPATTGTAPAGWQLLMSDDFSGTTLDTTKWFVYGPHWPGNGGNGIRDGSAVSVGGGVLTITAQMVDGTLVSGAVGSRLNLTYGLIEFRVRTDPDPSQATSGVVLMWPQSNNWPIDGEDDIYETGTNPTRSYFSSFVHYGSTNQQYWIGQAADATQWHTMAMEWLPDSISFYRDGTLEGTITNPAAITHAAHHLCIQLDAFNPTMTGVVRMQVADVRIYAPSG
jgi:hypothetical protein